MKVSFVWDDKLVKESWPDISDFYYEGEVLKSGTPVALNNDGELVKANEDCRFIVTGGIHIISKGDIEYLAMIAPPSVLVNDVLEESGFSDN